MPKKITDAERWDTLLSYVVDQGIDSFPSVKEALEAGCPEKFEHAVDEIVVRIRKLMAVRKEKKNDNTTG